MNRIYPLTCLVLLLAISSTTAQWRDVQQKQLKGHTLYTVFEAGQVPALLAPEMVPVAEVGAQYRPEEPLLVVAADREVHAYSTWHMEDHLVVNDRLADKSVVATW